MRRQVSVVVRARDEADRIGRCLELVAGQRLEGPPPELIVVDNGSRDATAEIARRRGAAVLSIPREGFSFGRALNLGAAAATGAVVVALSADAFVTDPDWLGRALAWLSDPQVACTSGDRYDPRGGRLGEPVRQDLSLARANPGWGYSNGAGAFRAELWRQRPFREDLPGCEDKEWAWHWLGAGYSCVIDPQLSVEHDHTHDSLLGIYRRARRESEGLAAFLPSDGPPLLTEWWSDVRFYSSPLRARLSHRRAARLLGAHTGRRRVRGRA
jgi:glycosyltransferase involved in cell wall biosynthesis